MNRQIEMVLNTDERGCYEANLVDPNTQNKYLPCVITGTKKKKVLKNFV
jgi:hypothetical protein